MFSEKMARELPSHTSYDHVINLVRGDLLKSLIYKLSEKELGVLKEYLDNNLSKDWICRLISPASIPIIFVSKKDSSLQIYINYQELNNKT